MENRKPWRWLSKADVESLLPNIHWNSYHRRTRKIFFSKVATLPPDVLEKLEQDALKLLRDRGNEELQEVPARKTEAQAQREDMAREARRRKMGSVVTNPEFLHDIGSEDRKKLLKRFIDGTSNAKTEQDICCSCGGLYGRCDFKIIPLCDIPDPTTFHPFEPHPGHQLIEGMLLEHRGVFNDDNRASGRFCDDCVRYVNNKQTPPLSLANNMWIGEIPFEFEVLTVPERLLISLYYPAVYVYKLYPKNLKAKNINFKHQQLRGNVSTYRLSPQEMANVVTGGLLPRKPDVLASLISITLVGWKNQPEKTLAGMLRVRRKRVLDALLWAKKNNPFYANIEIDEDALNGLPEDGLPESLMSSIAVTDDVDIAMQEMETYIPDVDEGEDMQSNEADLGDSGNFDDDEEIQEPRVIPIAENAVVDVNGYDIPTEELLWHGIQNAQQNEQHQCEAEEPRYLYRRGTKYVNEYPRRTDDGEVFEGTIDNPNHLLGAFPYLFPYGVGGFEVRRKRKVSYRDHAKWALRYHDGRFAKNITFIAQVFNVIQKREVCKAAEIQVSRRQFKKYAHIFRSINVRDLKLASEEEGRGQRISNGKVRLLKRLITSTRRNVIGTDEHRQSLRSRIFGMILTKGPPTFWLTINFADMKDPLVQVFCGENIDMDEFHKNVGLKSEDMNRNATENPFATTRAFFFLMTLFFEELLGIKITSWGHLQRQLGMFGRTEAYMGSIEAQGRGTLHAHLFIWLTGSPTSTEMQELLKDESFRRRLENFISENVRSHVEGLDETYIQSETPQDRTRCQKISSAFSRPLNPDDENFEVKYTEFEFSSARIHHMHTCSDETCKRGRKSCKRGAPWKVCDNTTVLENGEWFSKRKLKWLNTWNPLLMLAFRCNHDIKILTNASGTRDIVWYTTKYASKRQAKSFNMSAMLATKYLFNQAQMTNASSIRAANQKMLSQCVNTIGRYQEFSSQQLVALIMGFGDRFQSHTFVSVHLRHLMDTLRDTFPELKSEQGFINTTTELRIDTDKQVTDGYDMATMEETDAGLKPKSQVADYMNRGSSLDEFSFLDFWLESYEPRANMKRTYTRHERVPYNQDLDEYKGRYRILRRVEAEIIPDFLGSWPPRNNDPLCRNLYCATILALLMPWRSWDDLKGSHHSWEAAFNNFFARTHDRNRFIIENIQFYYDSRDSAMKNRAGLAGDAEETIDNSDDVRMEEPGDAMEVDAITATDDLSENELKRLPDNPNEMLFGEKAVQVGVQVGALTYQEAADWMETSTWQEWTPEMIQKVQQWKQVLNPEEGGDTSFIYEEDNESVVPPATAMECDVDPRVAIDNDSLSVEEGVERTLQDLTPEQRRACTIVTQHLEECLKGSDDQLFMQIVGSGGVGKSVVIRAIEDIFKIKGVRSMLAITATTGIAASHIGGQTIHHWAGLPIHPPPRDGAMPRSSMKMNNRRVKNMEDVRFLIIDEISMFTLSNMALLSRYVADVHDPTGSNGGKPFGGKLNVIVVGDYHQFPPPANNAQLMYLSKPPEVNIWAQKGYRIFQDFRTVVVLKKQMRATDDEWAALLERVRVSETTAEDVEILKKLTLTDPSCDVPDFSVAPWKDAVLVTPRHGVRNAWNKAMVAKKAYELRKTILVVDAKEHTARQNAEVPLEAKRASAQLEHKWKLPYEIEMFEGMRSLITHNVCVDAHMANGTIGTLERIVLDPREPPIPKNARRHKLKFQPVVLLFKPDQQLDREIPDLPSGTLPIDIAKATLAINLGPKRNVTVHRTQFPLTPAYAFTDYKAQAQSLSPLIVDIAKPPSGALTPFNTYVALSRSRRREFTRILRDFDRRLFMQELGEDLRLFDEKLKLQHNETREKYKHSLVKYHPELMQEREPKGGRRSR